MTEPASRPLRDRPTLRAYAALGVVGYAIGALGPTLALLRDRLDLGDLVYGIHPSMLAVGVIFAGTTGEVPLRRFGRGRLLRASLTLLAAACAALAYAPAAAVSLLATLAFGIGLGLALAAISADLRARHGALAAVALSEANVVASATGVLAPAALAGLVAAGFDGRGAMLVVAVLAVPLVLRGARTETPLLDSAPAAVAPAPPRRGSFVRWWIFLFLCVSVETCLLFWTAPYLEHRAGLSTSAAGSALTAFFAAQVTGRVVGTGIVRRRSAESVLAVSLAFAAAGLLLLWIATAPVLAVAGLAFASFGIANLYPLGAGLTLAAGASPDRAGVRVSLAIGAAEFTAPSAIGGLAAIAGLGVAFAAVPALTVAAAVALAAAARSG